MVERVSKTPSKGNSSTATDSNIGQSDSQKFAPESITHKTASPAQIAQPDNFKGAAIARCGHRAAHHRTLVPTQQLALDGATTPPLQAGASSDQNLGSVSNTFQPGAADATKQQLEVANVFRSLGASFVASLPAEFRHVVQDIIKCRTAALGGHIEECNQCSHQQNAYNSCRNRHCPKCQGTERREWFDKRKAELLPVEYYHIVFTLPGRLLPLALQNKRIIYRLLFKAAPETLMEVAADPQYLGAEIGIIAMLQTWGGDLQFHPHLHCVVPGGGPSLDHSKWVACHKGPFLPKKTLSSRFRRKFISELRKLFDKGKLRCEGHVSYLKQRDHFENFLDDLSQIEWKVYSEPPFGGPEQVLKYLARYINRVAISNQRLLEFTDGKVTFSREGYASGDLTKPMTLDVEEFTRRFLLHVLPNGYKAIRYFGFLANRYRRKKLDLCRRLLEPPSASAQLPNLVESKRDKDQIVLSRPARCPVCREGQMITIETMRRTTISMNKNPIADSS
jgi:hypothetical protein